jgi:hypothetical protein
LLQLKYTSKANAAILYLLWNFQDVVKTAAKKDDYHHV